MATVIPGEASETDDDDNDYKENSREQVDDTGQNDEEIRFSIVLLEKKKNGKAKINFYSLFSFQKSKRWSGTIS